MFRVQGSGVAARWSQPGILAECGIHVGAHCFFFFLFFSGCRTMLGTLKGPLFRELPLCDSTAI